MLVYVDDLLVAAESPQEGESFLQQLQTVWRIKLTGRIPALEKGVLQFLGRTIYRERDGESTLNLGVSEAYMTGVIDSWHEKLKPNEPPPKLEEIIYKDREKQGEDTPLTAEGEARYRRVLGQLAWAALSRADLWFFSLIPCAIPVEAIRCSRSLFACTVALVVDAPSPRADHAFSGRIAKRRTAKRCWFLRRVLECGLRVRGGLDVRRLLHQGVF